MFFDVRRSDCRAWVADALLGDSIPIVLGTIAVMGIGHACLAAPQLAAIDDVANRISDEIGIGSGAVISAFRTIERVGTAAGAVTVGAW